MSVGRGEVSGTGRLPSTLVAGLGRLARPEPVVEDEQCEVCGSRISADHRHLLELEERRILCACEPCIAMRSGVEKKEKEQKAQPRQENKRTKKKKRTHAEEKRKN
jgi:hypothetical protein